MPPFWLAKSPRLWSVAGHVGKHSGGVVGDLGIMMVIGDGGGGGGGSGGEMRKYNVGSMLH